MDFQDFIEEMDSFTGPVFSRFRGQAVLSVSGGADSMLLLYYFFALWKTGRLEKKPAVFHLNHCLRKDSDEDMKTVIRSACEMDLPVRIVKRDAGKAARRLKTGIEDAGRKIRYRNLKRFADAFPESSAFTAHHADDYAETFLMKLIRGGGVSSLSSLSHSAVLDGLPVLRPFLLMRKKDIESAAAKYSIPFRHDLSNDSDDFLRNRIRRSILPSLYREGMDPVLLWKNFHDTEAVPGAADPVSAASGTAGCLTLDALIFSGGVSAHYLKPVLDASLLALGLPSMSRSVFSEFLKQSKEGQAEISTKYYTIWKPRTGPLWIWKQNSPLLKDFQFLEIEKSGEKKTAEILYAGQKRNYDLFIGDEAVSGEEGLKMKIKSGRKPVKKIFQEMHIPPAFRKKIPVIKDRNTGLAVRICLSFLGGREDRVAER